MKVQFTNDKHTKVRDKELEDAKSWGASKKVLDFLFTINVNAIILQRVNRYLHIQIPYYGEEACLREVVRCLEIYNPKDKYLIYFLFPHGNVKDALFDSHYKDICPKCTFPSAGESAYYKRNLLFDILEQVQEPECVRILFKLLDERNICYLLRITPNLLKDFCKNKENSYVYHAISKNINMGLLHRYCNDDNHENTILEAYFEKHPEIIEQGIGYTFLETPIQEMALDLTNNVIKTLANTYMPLTDKYGIIDTLSDERCKELAVVLNGVGATINERCYSLKITISSAGWLNLTMRKHDGFFIDKEGKAYTGHPTKEVCIAITPDKQYYMSSTKYKRLIPLSIRKIAEYYQESELFKGVFVLLFDCEAENNIFAKDILSNIQSMYSLIPGSLNELLTYHNKKEFIESKYKDASKLKIDYNKISLNLSYMLIKSYRYVDKNSFGILQNLRNDELANITGRDLSDKINTFLQMYYIDKLHISNQDEQRMIYDWIRMKKQMREKIPLTKNSIRKIREDHDRLANYIEQKRYSKAKVTVPKNTKFAKLRKILPEEFEWIKTRKRLNNESAMQHHCVWSYGPDINNDRCAIYSFVDKTGEFTQGWEGVPVRYTIQFITKNKEYKINQIQAKYNSFSSEELGNYLRDLLKSETI